jgi:Baseplate J-like protein
MIATEPMETIHLYYEQDEEPTPPTGGFDVWIALFSLVCFALLIWRVCSISPVLETVIVPAHFLPMKTFSTTITVIPTGVKTYPATTAHGIITITNGSILSGELPKGIILTGKDGVEIVTDTAVFIPAGSAAGYGVATVSAHAVVSGKKGNIPAYDIDSVVNTSIYIRNLTDFTGGKQGYSITYTTPQDRLTALSQARSILSHLAPQTMLYAPCRESLDVVKSVVKWACQYVTYTHPVFFQVVGIEVRGKNIVLYGYPVVQSRRMAVR